MKKKADKENMRLRLAGLCARSEQNEFDLRQKIQRAGLSSDDSDEIIDFLKAGGYLDEKRYAKAYANDKVRFSGWGVNKIRRGLMMKRIRPDIVDEAMSGIDRKEYLAALKRAGIAAARETDMLSREGKAKFYRKILGRGFESEMVIKLAEAIIKKMKERGEGC